MQGQQRLPSKGVIDKAWIWCHPRAQICYSGCETDEDCRVPPWTAITVCDKPSHQCVDPARLEAGVADAGNPDADIVADDGPLTDAGKRVNGAKCTNKDQCDSHYCVDDRCCESACDGRCEACNIDHRGTCAAVPKGGGAEECMGDPGCQGACDGLKGCIYPEDDPCNQQCEATATGGRVKVSFCNLDGKCLYDDTADIACKFSVCTQNGREASCPGDCDTHSQCLAESLCDRTEAHASGKGTCVDPQHIATAAGNLRTADNTAELNLLVTAALESQAGPQTDTPYVRVAKGAGTLELPNPALELSGNQKLVLVGIGAMPEIGGGDNLRVISVSDSAQLVLQGVQVAKGTAAVISCNLATATVQVIESQLGGNGAGVGIKSECALTVRRSTIEGNRGGGILVTAGNVILTNTLFNDNGNPTNSAFGAAVLQTSGTVTFVNNTVVNNQAKTSAAGVVCINEGIKLFNSIIAGNDNAEVLTCNKDDGANVIAETLAQACQLDAFKPTTAPCIDGGNNDAADGLNLDRDNTARKQGDRVDVGAYEVE